jgi:hypothetical protein
MRWTGSGLGPLRGAILGTGPGISHSQRKGGRQRTEKPRHSFGETRVRREGGQLVLPQIDEPLGEGGEIGVWLLVARGLHGGAS